MARYEITAPDGSKWEVNAPDGATEDAVMRYAKAMWKPKAQEVKADPTEGTGTGQRILEGAGKAFVDIGRGLGQRVGLISQDEIDESARLDAPLMKTGAGVAGNIIGNVALAAPTAAIPGANTLAGAGAIGAALGALQPTKTGESVARNTLGGAAFSAAVPAAVAGGKALKAMVDPFTESGQARIASETIKRFATNPNKAAQALRNPAQYVPGVKPTAAEASLDPGIAVLQRSAASADPQMAGAFSAREAENAAARLAALRGVAGDADKMAFYKSSRDATAKELYERAFSEVPADTKWIKGQVTQLMKRPAFVAAMKEGQKIAANEGLRLGKGGKFLEKDATRILHYTKMALDDQAANATGNAKKAILDTRDKVVSLLESKDFSPSYREARDTYAKMSRPISQMEVGQELYNKMQPALSDFAGDAAALPRIRSEAYAQAVRNADETAKRATGFKGAKMESVMEPEQMQAITGVAKDLSRRATAQEIGKVQGSPTAQYLSSQNLMRQIAGPTGLPQSWVESALMQTMARPLDFAAKRSDPMIQQKIAQTLLDPGMTADALAKVMRKQPELLGLLGRYLPVTTGAGLLSYTGQ